jgi:hypothetical protein
METIWPTLDIFWVWLKLVWPVLIFVLYWVVALRLVDIACNARYWKTDTAPKPLYMRVGYSTDDVRDYFNRLDKLTKTVYFNKYLHLDLWFVIGLSLLSYFALQRAVGLIAEKSVALANLGLNTPNLDWGSLLSFVLPIVGFVADAIENICHQQLLRLCRNSNNRGEHSHFTLRLLTHIASAATQIKLLCFTIICCILLFGFICSFYKDTPVLNFSDLTRLKFQAQ